MKILTYVNESSYFNLRNAIFKIIFIIILRFKKLLVLYCIYCIYKDIDIMRKQMYILRKSE